MQVFHQSPDESQQRSDFDRSVYYKNQPASHNDVSLYVLTKQELLDLQTQRRRQQFQQQQQLQLQQQTRQPSVLPQKQSRRARSRSIGNQSSGEHQNTRRTRSREHIRLNPQGQQPQAPPPSQQLQINDQQQQGGWLQQQQLRLMQFQLQHEERQEHRKSKQIKAHSSGSMRRSSVSIGSTLSHKSRPSSTGRSKSAGRHRRIRSSEPRRIQSMTAQKHQRKPDTDVSPRRASSVGPGESLLFPRRPSLEPPMDDYEEDLIVVRHPRRTFGSRIRGRRQTSASPSPRQRNRRNAEDTRGLLATCNVGGGEDNDEDERLGEAVQGFWSAKRWFHNSRSPSLSRSSSSTPRSVTPFSRRQTIPMSEERHNSSYGALDFTQMIVDTEPRLSQSYSALPPLLVSEPPFLPVVSTSSQQQQDPLATATFDKEQQHKQQQQQQQQQHNAPVTTTTEQTLRHKSSMVPQSQQEHPARDHILYPEPPSEAILLQKQQHQQYQQQQYEANLMRSKSKLKAFDDFACQQQKQQQQQQKLRDLSGLEQSIQQDVVNSNAAFSLPSQELAQDEAPKRLNKKHKRSKSKSKSPGPIEVAASILMSSQEDVLDGSVRASESEATQGAPIEFEASLRLCEALAPPRREHKAKRAKSRSKSLGPLEASASELHLSKKQIKKEIKAGRLCIQLTTSGETLLCLTQEPDTMPMFEHNSEWKHEGDEIKAEKM